MSVIRAGDSVHVYYYGEANSVRSLRGTVQERDQWGVTVVSLTGDLQEFPITSIQRLILIEAKEDRFPE